LYLSTFGRTVNGSEGPLAEMCESSSTCEGTKESLTVGYSLTGKEYAKVDFRWGTADPVLLSLEIPTVLGAGPLGCYVMGQMIRDDPVRHYWIIVLSTFELYGG